MKMYIASIVIAVTIGIARAQQAGDISSMDGVLRCVDSSVETVPVFHHVAPTDQLLTFLERDLNNTIREARDTLDRLKGWGALFVGKTYTMWQTYVKRLQIPKPQHNNLSEIESSRLHVYLQLANYANFLMKQETAGYTQISGGAGSLLKPDLRIKICRLMCKIRELLQLNEEKLRVFATQDIAGHLLPLDDRNLNSSMKRAACRAAIELMFNTIKRIPVNI